MALNVTQCPSCESTFNTSARVLEAAHGLVRCGACLSVFEANENYINSLPPASNDELDHGEDSSVFISGSDDYFDPTTFLQRSDLQDEIEDQPVDETPLIETPLTEAPLTEPAETESADFEDVENDEIWTITDLTMEQWDSDLEGEYGYDKTEFGGPDEDTFIELPDEKLPESHTSEAELTEGEPPEVKLSEGEIPNVELPGVEFNPAETSDIELAEIEPFDDGLDTGEPPEVKLSEGAIPDVELPGVEFNPAEPSDIELAEIEPFDDGLDTGEPPEVKLSEGAIPDVELPGVEFNPAEPSDIELAEIEPFDDGLDTGEPPGVKLSEGAIPDVELPGVEFNPAEPSDIELAEIEPFDDGLDTGEPNTEETESIPTVEASNEDQFVTQLEYDSDRAQHGVDISTFFVPTEDDKEIELEEGSDSQLGEPDLSSASDSNDDNLDNPVYDDLAFVQPDEYEPTDNAEASQPDNNDIVVENPDISQPEHRPSESIPTSEIKEELRARLETSDLRNDDGNLESLSRENLAAISSVDSSLELEQARPMGRLKRTLVLTLASVCLLFVLAGQFFWLRMPILSLDSELRPGYELACRIFNCELPPIQDLINIQTENLVIRSHPEYENSLVLTAVFRNIADYQQPFPIIELSFSDLDSQPIASREFYPSEYLPPELRAITNMPVGAPVQISVELVDPGETAVNYHLNYKPFPGSF